MCSCLMEQFADPRDDFAHGRQCVAVRSAPAQPGLVPARGLALAALFSALPSGTMTVWVSLRKQTAANSTVAAPTAVLVSTTVGGRATGYCILAAGYKGAYAPARFREPPRGGIARFVPRGPATIRYELEATCTVKGYPSRSDSVAVGVYG